MVEPRPKTWATSGSASRYTPMLPSDPPSQTGQGASQYSHPAYQDPQPQPPKYIISAIYGPPLDSRLRALANALFELDHKFLKRLDKSAKKLMNQVDGNGAAAAQERSIEFPNVRRQWTDVQNGSNGFAASYLTDTAFIQLWYRALKDMKRLLSSAKNDAVGDNVRDGCQTTLRICMFLAATLEETLVNAASLDLLSVHIEKSVEARWSLLDNFLDWYFTYQNPNCKDGSTLTREIPNWHVISNSLREVREMKSAPDTKGSVIKNALFHERPSHSLANTFPVEIISPVLVSCLIFLCGATLSTALFAVGYSRSSHQRGSTYDPDFWFFVQASVSQATCLVSSTLLTRRTNRALTWHWLLPTMLASLCTLLTAPLYIWTPSEWASFSALVATMLQSVLILQQYLFSTTAAQEVQERKSK
ncbi:hypothetical protein BKA66DRAFT_34509 [Pyrenochaeta sp. MPI-SDFR-AT-0127]|nr:hypothetical protein BKA66DRAFT_34509 [Pyrenochaeta sp. MPI-SDFR-AT-0127]